MTVPDELAALGAEMLRLLGGARCPEHVATHAGLIARRAGRLSMLADEDARHAGLWYSLPFLRRRMPDQLRHLVGTGDTDPDEPRAVLLGELHEVQRLLTNAATVGPTLLNDPDPAYSDAVSTALKALDTATTRLLSGLFDSVPEDTATTEIGDHR